MITCQNCKIKIDAKFSFCIKSNQCPGCGKNIMDEEKSDMLSYVMKTMSDQSFSSKVDSSILNEICFFIFSEFIDVEDELSEDIESIDTNDFSETPEEDTYPPDEDSADQQFGDTTSMLSSKDDESIDDKAQRLREKYKYDKKVMDSKRKTGVSVRRITT